MRHSDEATTGTPLDPLLAPETRRRIAAQLDRDPPPAWLTGDGALLTVAIALLVMCAVVGARLVL
jgi:hypothetical protein